MRRLAAAGVTLAFALALAPRATASPRDPVAAQALFERGREAAARGDSAAACDLFEESLRLDLAVGTLFNLAACEEQLGRLASAWQHLREGLDLLDPSDPRRPKAEVSLRALSARVPRLEVRLDARRDGQRIVRDGVELAAASLDTPLPVNPGPHEVIVREPGRAEARYGVTLVEGEQRVLVVAAGPPEIAPARAIPAAPGPAPTPAPTPPADAPGPRDATPEVWISLTPLASLGIGPGATLGGRAGASAAWPSWSLDLEGAIESTPGSVAVGADRAQLLVATAGLVPCRKARESPLRTCAVLRLGAASGEATSVATSTPRTTLAAFAGVRVGLDLRVASGLAVEPAVDLGASLVRTRFEVDGRDLWTAPALHASVGVGLRARPR